MAKFIKNFELWNISDALTAVGWARLDQEFVNQTHDLKTSHYRQIVDAVVKEMDAYTAEQWTKSLDQIDAALGLLLKLVSFGERPLFDASLYDALRSHVEGLVGGSKLPSKYQTEWHLLFEMLPRHRQTQLAKAFRDRVLDRAPKASLIRQIIDLFGAPLLTFGGLDERANDVIRVIIDPILAEASVESRAFLKKYPSALGSVVASANADERQGLLDRIIKLRESEGDGVKDDMLEIASSLGLRVPDENPESDSGKHSSDQSSS